MLATWHSACCLPSRDGSVLVIALYAGENGRPELFRSRARSAASGSASSAWAYVGRAIARRALSMLTRHVGPISDVPYRFVTKLA